jgi:hypothetical protein
MMWERGKEQVVMWIVWKKIGMSDGKCMLEKGGKKESVR